MFVGDALATFPPNDGVCWGDLLLFEVAELSGGFILLGTSLAFRALEVEVCHFPFSFQVVAVASCSCDLCVWIFGS